MNFYSIAPFIQEFYPQYYSIEAYPVDGCAAFCKVDDEWGIFSNFGRTPIVLDGVTFNNAERIFQLMKFRDEEPVLKVYNANNPKPTAKHWEKTHRRADWGKMIVDAMKFCLTKKYEQNENFRQELERSRGLFIVEDQRSFRKKNPDTWGVKPVGDFFEGPNLMGRLLMELRDNNGRLDYKLPDDALHFLSFLK